MLSWLDPLLALLLWGSGIYQFRRAVHRLAGQRTRRGLPMRWRPDKAALGAALLGGILVALGTVLVLLDIALAWLV